MLVEITFSEFHDRIQAFDSCSLSYEGTRALFDWIEERIEDGILDANVCIGDWAIQTFERSLDDLAEEHECEFQAWGDVEEAISRDFLDNCYSDVIPIGGFPHAAVMVSL